MSSSTALDKLIARSLSGGLPIFVILISLLAGAIALIFTAREEEPQIVVPMVDVLVHSPGLSAPQVERQITTPPGKTAGADTGRRKCLFDVYGWSNFGDFTILRW